MHLGLFTVTCHQVFRGRVQFVDRLRRRTDRRRPARPGRRRERAHPIRCRARPLHCDRRAVRIAHSFQAAGKQPLPQAMQFLAGGDLPQRRDGTAHGPIGENGIVLIDDVRRIASRHRQETTSRPDWSPAWPPRGHDSADCDALKRRTISSTTVRSAPPQKCQKTTSSRPSESWTCPQKRSGRRPIP